MKLLNAVAVLTAAIAPVWAQRTASEIAADKVGALNMHNVASKLALSAAAVPETKTCY